MIRILMAIWAVFFGANVSVPQNAVAHYDCDEYWTAYAAVPASSEADIIASALKEFDAIYNSIELDVQIITRKCGRYDAMPKRQIIIRRDNKFVGGKVLGYANAYQIWEWIREQHNF